MKQLEDIAYKLIHRIRKADEKLKEYEPNLEDSFQEIKRQVEVIEKKRRKRSFFYWSFSAAALFVLIFLFSWFYNYEKPYLGRNSSLAFMDSITMKKCDSIQLVVAKQLLFLKDDVSLVYHANKTGNSVSNKKMSEDSVVLITQNQQHQIIVPYGKHASVTFADGTRMQVNSGSKVVYSDGFDSNQREILVDGEVYLQVAKSKDCPFVVKTKNFQVKVLGTEFNVSAYQDDPSASVVLVNGSVEVESKKQKTILEPNQLAEIQTRGISVKNIDAYEYICWKDKILLLRDRPLNEVWKKLERYYNCSIFSSPETDSIRLSGKLDLQDNISDVMDILSTSADFSYTLNEKNHVYVLSLIHI